MVRSVLTPWSSTPFWHICSWWTVAFVVRESWTREEEILLLTHTYMNMYMCLSIHRSIICRCQTRCKCNRVMLPCCCSARLSVVAVSRWPCSGSSNGTAKLLLVPARSRDKKNKKVEAPRSYQLVQNIETVPCHEGSVPSPAAEKSKRPLAGKCFCLQPLDLPFHLCHFCCLRWSP